MMKSKEFNQVYQFKITLEESEPSIWRRIQVSETSTFRALHLVIQDVMGWDECHLHEFKILNPSTGLEVNIGMQDEDAGEDVLPEKKKYIADYFSMKNPSANYTYDFGDNWKHTIQLEKILPREEKIDYPICIGGERACPPEDCGGIGGYEDFLEIIKDPKHEEYEDMLTWIGGSFDPEDFDHRDIVFQNSKKLKGKSGKRV